MTGFKSMMPEEKVACTVYLDMKDRRGLNDYAANHGISPGQLIKDFVHQVVTGEISPTTKARKN